MADDETSATKAQKTKKDRGRGKCAKLLEKAHSAQEKNLAIEAQKLAHHAKTDARKTRQEEKQR